MKALKGDYVFTVTSFVAGAPLVNSSASLTVTPVASDLFATVAGGSSRKQSRLSALSLDASASYDPDMSPTSFIGHLNFSWACLDLSTRNPCTNASSGAALALDPKPTAEVPASALAAGTYLITATVACPSDGRNASTNVAVTLTSTPVPVVSIKALTVSKVRHLGHCDKKYVVY